jgi:glycosyltransferase involved in cell wall biosynthesis
MRVGLDARFLTHPQFGGFKTYVSGLVEGLAQLDAPIELVLYVDRAGAPELENLGPRFEIRVVSGSLPVVGFAWREQVLLPRAIARDGLDVFHAPCHTAPWWLPTPLVVTVHDMIWHASKRPPGVRRAALHEYYQAATMRAIAKARVLVTISEVSRRALCEALPFIDPSAIVVVHNAPRARFRQVTDAAQRAAVATALRLPPQFILGQASADPRKNLPALLQAFARLPPDLQRDYPLVVVWAHTALMPAARAQCDALAIGDRVQFLHGVTDDELAAIYSMATLFVFPSVAEGFAMPPLEAMICGTPVVMSDHEALVETTGDAALTVDVRNLDELTDAIASMLRDPEVRRDYIERGARCVRRFTWRASASRTVEAYQMAARHRPSDA